MSRCAARVRVGIIRELRSSFVVFCFVARAGTRGDREFRGERGNIDCVCYFVRCDGLLFANVQNFTGYQYFHCMFSLARSTNAGAVRVPAIATPASDGAIQVQLLRYGTTRGALS